MSIHVTCLIKRRPDLTHEQFIEYWDKKHAPIFTCVDAVKRNLVRYTQYQILQNESSKIAALGIPVPEFDGAAEFWVEKLEDLLEMLGDEEFVKNVAPDEENFVDRSSIRILVGEDKTKYERQREIVETAQETETETEA